MDNLKWKVYGTSTARHFNSMGIEDKLGKWKCYEKMKGHCLMLNSPRNTLKYWKVLLGTTIREQRNRIGQREKLQGISKRCLCQTYRHLWSWDGPSELSKIKALTGLRERAISWARHLLSAKGYAWNLTQLWVIRGQHPQQLEKWEYRPWMEDSGVGGYHNIH